MQKSERTQVIGSNWSDELQLDDTQNKPGLFFRHLKSFLECLVCISGTRLSLRWVQINMNVTLMSLSTNYRHICIIIIILIKGKQLWVIIKYHGAISKLYNWLGSPQGKMMKMHDEWEDGSSREVVLFQVSVVQ